MGSKNETFSFNPFPGLRPFEPEDCDLFFGRERESNEILQLLLKNRFITVIGDSGTGKSSLISCGVLSKIRSLESKGSADWKIITFRPGNNPFGNLAEAISGTVAASGMQKTGIDNILLEMHLNQDGITSALKKFLIRGNEKVLIVIDQFEEIFRFSAPGESGSNESYTAEFVGKIVKAVSHPDSVIHTIVTMRSDFIGECSHYQGLTQIINNSNYLVPNMDRESYRQVIEGPVKYAGASIEPELVETILDDIGERTDQLPVIQHALMRTWAFWQKLNETGRQIGITDYNAVGTMSDAMSRHADEAYEELDSRGREICEKMFRAITEKGTNNKGLRHPSDVKTLIAIIQCTSDDLFHVIEKFRMPSRSFIIPRQDVPLNEDSVIDLSHESLIRLWNRLKEWVDQEAASVQMYQQLSEASSMYQQGKTGLMRPPVLQLATNWRDRQKPNLAWARRYNPAFERAMVYLRTSETTFHDEEESKIRRQKSKIRRTRVFALILGTSAMISLGFMSNAFIQRIKADNAKAIAENNQKKEAIQRHQADSISSVALRQKEIADSIALAARQKAEEAVVQTNMANEQRSLAVKNANNAQMQISVAELRADSAKKASIRARQNEELATDKENEALRLRMLAIGKSMSIRSLQMQGQKDLQTLLAYQAYLFNRKNGGSENDADIYNSLYNVAREYGNVNYKSYNGHTGQAIKSIAFLPGKREFFTSGDDGKVLKWDLDGDAKTYQVIYSGTDIIEVLAISPDASVLACGSNNSTIHLIPLKGNSMRSDLNGHSDKIKSLIFSYDGKYLYSASLDGKVLKWDMSTRTNTDLNATGMQINSIDVTSDGNYIAGISNDGKVIVWNSENNTNNFRIPTEGREIKVVRFKPDENIIALGDADGSIDLWDINTRKKISEVKAHAAQVNDIQFNPQLKQMATAGNDRNLKIFNIQNVTDLSETPVTLSDNEGFVLVMKFSPDGQMIVSGTYEGARNLVSRPTHADNLVKDICTLVARNMTRDEWNNYVGKDIAREETCPQKSFIIKATEVK